jgi:hypothetical protein
VARSLGPVLPDALLGRLLAPADEVRTAVLLLTVDPFGWPHPALLSYAELVALDAGRLRAGLHAGSRTERHLRDSGRATLVFADAEMVVYVKAEAVPLPAVAEAPGLARFELAIRDVLEDRAEGEETGARLESGLRIVWAGDPEAVAARAGRTRRALRL